MKLMLLTTLLMASAQVFSATGTVKENALKYVKEGKVVHEKDNEVKVQTKAGTIVEVEFKNDGTLEEASGKALDQDIFEPGNGLISLKDAREALKKAGKTPVGEWSFDNSLTKGWNYEFEGFENGSKIDYVVDAKNGKLLESRIDN